MRRVCALIHGDSGVGKSRLLDTAPGPRLTLDVEGGVEWCPSPKVHWDPRGPLEAELTPETTVVVNVRDFHTLELVDQWLSAGKVPVESLCFDSVTEGQKRCKDSLAGTSQMDQQVWGQLLTRMEVLVRGWRDLRYHPVQPMNVFISALSTVRENKMRPDVQGALSKSLPTFPDVVAYMFAQDSGDGTQRTARFLQIQPNATVLAKDRTDLLTQKFGPYICTSVERESVCDLACLVCTVNGIEESK